MKHLITCLLGLFLLTVQVTGQVTVNSDYVSSSTVTGNLAVQGTTTLTGTATMGTANVTTGNIGTLNVSGSANLNWNGIPAAYIMDGVDDYVTSAFTQSTQAVEMLVYPTVTNKALCTFGTNMGITFNSSNVIQYGSSFANVTTYVNGAVGTTLTLNKWNHIIAVFDAITPTVLEVGRSGSTYFTGRVWGFRPSNRPLTAAEVTQRWNNGAPHLYRLEYADTKANNTEMVINGTFAADTDWIIGTGVTISDGKANVNTASSGILIRQIVGIKKGKMYRVKFTLSDVVSGGVYVMPGGYSAGTYVTANGTYTQVINAGASADNQLYISTSVGGFVGKIDDVSCVPIGCTLELLPENSGANGGLDPMNGLHWSTSGNPIAPQGLRDYRDTVSTTPVALTNTQKAQTILTRIVATNNDGSNARTISIGTTSGGTELVNAQSIAAGSTIVISVGSYSAVERTLYAVASGASVNIQMIYEKVAQ